MDISKEWLFFNRAKVIREAFYIHPFFKELLSRCRIAIEPLNNQLLIESRGAELEISIHSEDWKECMEQLLKKLELTSAKILKEGKLTEVVSMNALGFLYSQEKEIMEELYESPYHKTVVTRKGGKVLICSPQLQTRAFCELDSVSIIGNNAKEVWLPEEWDKRDEYLAKDGFINNYVYDGYRRVEVEKGNPQLHKFVGDFRLVKFYDTECILSTFRFA